MWLDTSVDQQYAPDNQEEYDFIMRLRQHKNSKNSRQNVLSKLQTNRQNQVKASQGQLLSPNSRLRKLKSNDRALSPDAVAFEQDYFANIKPPDLARNGSNNRFKQIGSVQIMQSATKLRKAQALGLHTPQENAFSLPSYLSTEANEVNYNQSKFSQYGKQIENVDLQNNKKLLIKLQKSHNLQSPGIGSYLINGSHDDNKDNAQLFNIQEPLTSMPSIRGLTPMQSPKHRMNTDFINDQELCVKIQEIRKQFQMNRPPTQQYNFQNDNVMNKDIISDTSYQMSFSKVSIDDDAVSQNRQKSNRKFITRNHSRVQSPLTSVANLQSQMQQTPTELNNNYQFKDEIIRKPQQNTSQDGLDQRKLRLERLKQILPKKQGALSNLLFDNIQASDRKLRSSMNSPNQRNLGSDSQMQYPQCPLSDRNTFNKSFCHTYVKNETRRSIDHNGSLFKCPTLATSKSPQNNKISKFLSKRRTQTQMSMTRNVPSDTYHQVMKQIKDQELSLQQDSRNQIFLPTSTQVVTTMNTAGPLIFTESSQFKQEQSTPKHFQKSTFSPKLQSKIDSNKEWTLKQKEESELTDDSLCMPMDEYDNKKLDILDQTTWKFKNAGQQSDNSQDKSDKSHQEVAMDLKSLKKQFVDPQIKMNDLPVEKVSQNRPIIAHDQSQHVLTRVTRPLKIKSDKISFVKKQTTQAIDSQHANFNEKGTKKESNFSSYRGQPKPAINLEELRTFSSRFEEAMNQVKEAKTSKQSGHSQQMQRNYGINTDELYKYLDERRSLRVIKEQQRFKQIKKKQKSFKKMISFHINSPTNVVDNQEDCKNEYEDQPVNIQDLLKYLDYDVQLNEKRQIEDQRKQVQFLDREIKQELNQTSPGVQKYIQRFMSEYSNGNMNQETQNQQRIAKPVKQTQDADESQSLTSDDSKEYIQVDDDYDAVFHPAFQRLLELQMTIDKNKYDPFTVTENGCVKESDVEENRKIKEEMQFTLRILFAMEKNLVNYQDPSNLKNLNKIFDINMMEKYQDLDRQYKNGFLRKIADRKSNFKKIFNLYIGLTSQKKQNQLNSTFKDALLRQNYQKIKGQKHAQVPNKKDDQDLLALSKFDQVYQQKAPSMRIDPNLVKVTDGTMIFTGRQLDIVQCESIKEFLTFATSKTSKVRRLIIDNCDISEDGINFILDGIINQIKTKRRGGKANKQYLHSFVLNDCHFGPSNLEKLLYLNDDLLEFKLANVRTTNGFGQSMLTGLLSEPVSVRFKFLFKLSLAGINLKNNALIDALCDFLISRPYIQLLDVNKTGLDLRHLNKILETLANLSDKIRDVNLSFNSFAMSNVNEELVNDLQMTFIENLKMLIEKNQRLGHLNLNGMMLDQRAIIEICTSIAGSKNIHVVHLSENGICQDDQLYFKVLELFSIHKDQIPNQRRTEGQDYLKFDEPMNQSQKAQYAEFERKISQYFCHQELDQSQEGSNADAHKDEDPYSESHHLCKVQCSSQAKQMEYYTKHVLIGHQASKVQKKSKVENDSTTYNGFGRCTTNLNDSFVVSRILNHPELIYMNDPWASSAASGGQFFNKDEASKWRLSDKNECFICDHYKYVTVFYERGLLSGNKNLVEIRDKELLATLRRNYSNDPHNKTQTPLIFGTVVNRFNFEGTFQRKQKMLRTPLFALLSVLKCKHFLHSSIDKQKVKDLIIKFLESDLDDIMKIENIRQCLGGWRWIISDLAVSNELIDTHAVNFPDLGFRKLQKQDWYTFAGYFPPGYHKILIYDPLMERAFVKDFVVEMSSKDFIYPEAYDQVDKSQQRKKEKKVVPDMWAKWQVDTEEDIINIFKLEVESQEFQPFKIMKRQDEQQIQQILKIIQENMVHILILQKELLADSLIQFPQISWEAVIQYLETVQQSNTELQNYKKVQRSQIELTFISSTSNDETQSLRSAMQRSELLGFILRFYIQFFKLNFDSSKVELSQHLDFFLKVYVRSYVVNSRILRDRMIIRNSKALNELLFDNSEGLQEIFQDIRKIKGKKKQKNLSLEKCAKYFSQFAELDSLTSQGGTENVKMLAQTFVYSQMTIWNEYQNIDKYLYLHFIEFQEMLCRIALVSDILENKDGRIEQKVYNLLKIIYENKYDEGTWSPEDFPLYNVNYDKGLSMNKGQGYDIHEQEQQTICAWDAHQEDSKSYSGSDC